MSKLSDQIRAAAAFPELTSSCPIAYDRQGDEVLVYSESGFEEVIKVWKHEQYGREQYLKAQSFFKALERLELEYVRRS